MSEHNNEPEMAQLEALFDQILDEGISIIMQTHSFEALHQHLCTLFASMTQRIAASEDENPNPAAVDAATRAIATRTAFDLWNNTPVLENGFKPYSLPAPKAEDKCLCGSGKKFAQCCGAIDTPSIILEPTEMALHVLRLLPPHRIGEIHALQLPPDLQGRLAEDWLHEHHYENIIALLAPLFEDVSQLDKSAENAADSLLITYSAVGDNIRYEQLIENLRTAPDKRLACLPLQRDTLYAAQEGEFSQAWAIFEEAMRLSPGNPSLASLELLLLLEQGRFAEVPARADFWTRLLAADTSEDHSHIIDRINYMASEEGISFIQQRKEAALLVEPPVSHMTEYNQKMDARLDALPQNFAPRRLVMRIELVGTEPPVWRQIEVENMMSFAEFHLVLQEAMGWEECHLHEFIVGKERIGMSGADDFGFGDPPLPEDEVELGQLLGRRKQFDYIYDFGDDWHHRITIEQRKPSNPKLAPVILLDGKMACPPEDCGGIPGYYQIINTLADPSHPDYEETTDWLGRWKANSFSLAAARKRVAGLIKK